MSLTYTSPEALQKAQTSRRNAAISTLLVTFLAIGALLVALAFIIVRAAQKDPPVITPLAQQTDKPTVEKEELVVDPQPEPPSSSSSASMPVIQVQQISPIAIPETTLNVDTVNFGTSTGDGDFGLGDFGLAGSGVSGSSLALFGGAPVKGNRFAFVVDFSISNKPPQREAIKSELTKVVEGLSGNVQYQIIGFASPAWFLGDEVDFKGLKHPIIIKSGRGRNYEHKFTNNTSYYQWKSDKNNSNGGIPIGNWLSAAQKRQTLNTLDEILDKKYWAGGTHWGTALETALQMQPQPDVIYFLTDGHHNKGQDLTIQDVGRIYGERIEEAGIEFISIGLVSQKAANALKHLTAVSKGKLYLAQADGTSELIDDYSKMSTKEREEVGTRRRR